VKRGTPDHPKVYALAEALGIRRPAALGHLELLYYGMRIRFQLRRNPFCEAGEGKGALFLLPQSQREISPTLRSSGEIVRPCTKTEKATTAKLIVMISSR
jgi:hypothetical protein